MKYFSAAVVLCVHANGLSLTRSDRDDNPESSLLQSDKWLSVLTQKPQRLDVTPDQYYRSLEEGRQEEFKDVECLYKQC